MKASHFIYNVPVPPHRFIGRRRQTDQIMEQLAGAARMSSAISGDPRVGKTSLLHYLRAPSVHEAWGLSSAWCHFLYIDCHSIVPFTEAAFWRYILRELLQYLRDNETLTTSVQALLTQATPDMFDINSLFDQMARANRLAVLMLDEFEGIIENLDCRSPELLYHLRALLNRPERGLVVLTASREPLPNLCANFHFSGSPFDNCFSPITLPPFSQTEVNELLAPYQGDFSASEQDFLRQTVGAHPYLLQLTGAFMLRAKEQQPDGSPINLSAIKTDLERETEGYCADMLKYSSQVEKMLLTWLALNQLNRHLPPHLFNLGQWPKTLGRYDAEFKKLVARGLAQTSTAGAELFSSVFGRWVLSKALVAAGRDIITQWQADYVNFLSPAQQNAFKNLAEKIIECPAAVTKPELLCDLLPSADDCQPPPPPLPNTNAIRLTGRLYLSEPLKREMIKQLYQQNDQLKIAQIRLEHEFQGGLSGAQVILAQSIDDHGRGLAHEVLKIAPATVLRREYTRYRQFVKGRLPATAVRIENGPIEQGMWACLSYGFAGDRPLGAIKDLETYYATHSAAEVIDTLEKLMMPLDERWYGQSEPLLASFADEYDQQLPAHLWLLAEQITPGGLVQSDTHRLINIPAILNAQKNLEIGERVVIPDLEISQVTPQTIKLRCNSGGGVIWIQSKVTLPYLDLHEKDRVSVLGIVENRRDDILNAVMINVLNFAPEIRRLSGQLTLSGLNHPCPDPLTIYKQVLQRKLNGRKSIIHGDLHPGNILVDEAGRAWLIDFDHVREGHVLFDFVRLETLLRLFVLGGARHFQKNDQGAAAPAVWPYPFTLADYISFEKKLAQRTLGQSPAPIDHPDLAKAAEVIMAIRDMAQHYLRQRKHWREYLTGLFLQNVAQLRFYQTQPWLGVLPLITAAITGHEINEE